MPELTRVTRNPAVMGGKPCIRGMRVTVGTVVGLVAGRTRDEILREYPYWEAADIAEALSYRCVAGVGSRSSPEPPRVMTSRHGLRIGALGRAGTR